MRLKINHLKALLFVLLAAFSVPWTLVGAEGPKKVQVGGEESFSAEAVGDNGDVNESIYGDDDNFSRYINTIYFTAKNPVFDSALRLDTTFFHLPPERVSKEDFIPGGSGYTILDYDNDYRLEHLHGMLTLGPVTVTAGDFHVSFGRGMVLSLIKVDDLSEDNRLRGARIEYRAARKLSVTLVGGVVNPLNADPLTRQIYRDDSLDRIGGARVQLELLDALGIAVHGVIMRPRYTDLNQISSERLYMDQSPGVDLISGGGSLELHAEGVHFYIEGNGQSHTDYRTLGAAATPESGVGLFGEVSYDISGFSILGEGIFYRRWLMEGPYRGAGVITAAEPLVYNSLPTLDVNFVPNKSVGNAAGGRLTAGYFVQRINLDLRLRCAFIKSFGGLLPDGAWEDHPPTFAVHPTLQGETRIGEREVVLRVEGGARVETTSMPDVPEMDSGHLWHVSTDVTVPLRGPHSLKFDAEVRRHALRITEGNSYWVGAVTAGYGLAGRFDAALAYEYSDEITTTGNRIGDVPWLPSHHFFWVRSTLMLKEVRKGLSLRLFVGSERGGIKCVGGACRQYPDTVGVRLDAALSF